MYSIFSRQRHQPNAAHRPHQFASLPPSQCTQTGQVKGVTEAPRPIFRSSHFALRIRFNVTSTEELEPSGRRDCKRWQGRCCHVKDFSRWGGDYGGSHGSRDALPCSTFKEGSVDSATHFCGLRHAPPPCPPPHSPTHPHPHASGTSLARSAPHLTSGVRARVRGWRLEGQVYAALLPSPGSLTSE